MTSLQEGDQLDRYRIEALVARSGMASIYRATDTRDGRAVAIKIPHPQMESDPVFFDRFQREEEIGEKLDHPGVMKVYPNPGRSRVYMVMEWVEGRLLRSLLQGRARLPAEQAIPLVIAIADALDYIHRNGVVHRDLKPENIMIPADAAGSMVKLIDFGVAGKLGARRLTFGKLSQVVGTPDYIAPEQVRGKRGDGRSDIYALGIILYEMLTGTTPFTGSNPFAIMNDRLVNHPTPPREHHPGISLALQEVIYRALEREPQNRYSTAAEMAWDLEHLDQVQPAARAELSEWRRRKTPWLRRLLFYAMLVAIPVVVFGLLYLAARAGK
ncbi:MAG TPA: serine/threonine-protein kinase [Terriglobales bacterium]|nr:serine/threonine-protein kinase [Terriglobales bacterium]